MVLFSVEAVEGKLKVHFADKNILKQAFIHRSYWNESSGKIANHNERLEFLGDSVLGLLLAEYLYVHYPLLDEGSLSTLRSQLVDASACSGYVQKLAVEEFLLLGKGEQLNRGRGRDSILADLFEALVGAIYLDQGIDAARTFFFSHFRSDVEKIVSTPLRNWKAELQDYTQKAYQQVPLYEVLEESGPAHRKQFRVGVWIQGEKIAEAEGLSKKEAQTEAARKALQKIHNHE